MEEQREQPSYYAIIPATIRYDKDLKANEKLLYGEITSLTQKSGKCFASNNYFAELYGVAKETVSGWISNLEKKGYIKRDIIYKEGTKEIINRYITINEYPINEKINTPINEKINTPINEKIKGNTTSNNTTSINKERKKDNATFDEIINNFSENEETRFLLKEWLKVRKLKRAPLTNYAINLNLNKLHNLAKESNLSVNKYLEEVIARGWQAFYAINNYSIKDKNTNRQTSNDLQSAFERLGG